MIGGNFSRSRDWMRFLAYLPQRWQTREMAAIYVKQTGASCRQGQADRAELKAGHKKVATPKDDRFFNNSGGA